MTAPAVSILLPARDAGATLAAALASIVRQTDPDWECVVVDDGSTDQTAALAREAVALDGRFRLVGGPRAHAGIVGALTAGLKECRAPLIARMDADDLMRRDRLAVQRAALKTDPALAAVGSHVRMFPRGGLGDGARAYETWIASLVGAEDVARDAFVECPVVHPTLMIRRDALDAAGGWQDHGWPEDYDLVLRLLAAGHRIGNVPRRLLSWRDTPARLSRTHPTYAVEAFVRAKAHYLARGLLARTDRYALVGFGSTGKAIRKALLPHGKRPSVIVDLDPKRIGNRIDDADVIHFDAFHTTPDPILLAVAHASPRTEARAALSSRNLQATAVA